MRSTCLSSRHSKIVPSLHDVPHGQPCTCFAWACCQKGFTQYMLPSCLQRAKSEAEKQHATCTCDLSFDVAGIHASAVRDVASPCISHLCAQPMHLPSTSETDDGSASTCSALRCIAGLCASLMSLVRVPSMQMALVFFVAHSSTWR